MVFSGALTVTDAMVVTPGPLVLPPHDRPAATNRQSTRARGTARE
jgi:predicted small lipoprotein YifL